MCWWLKMGVPLMYNLAERAGNSVVDLFFHVVHCLTDVVAGEQTVVLIHTSIVILSKVTLSVDFSRLIRWTNLDSLIGLRTKASSSFCSDKRYTHRRQLSLDLYRRDRTVYKREIDICLSFLTFYKICDFFHSQTLTIQKTFQWKRKYSQWSHLLSVPSK